MALLLLVVSTLLGQMVMLLDLNHKHLLLSFTNVLTGTLQTVILGLVPALDFLQIKVL
jgi:hypothetical protein